MNLPLDKEYFGDTYEEYKNDGFPDKEITEMKISKQQSPKGVEQ